MDETITSEYDISYYLRATTGAIFFLWLTGSCVYYCLRNAFVVSIGGYIIILVLFGVLWLYYYFFSKSWKRITVTPTEIAVYDWALRKQTIIPYTDITRIGTYRTSGSAGKWAGSRGLAQDFVIEFGDNQSVCINEAWYQNYKKLTMTIYYHKYGPGHGRERYLARHSKNA